MRNLPETVHEYNISRLNVIFIISSLLLIGVVVWMGWDDFMREWKPYQRQAKQFEQQKLLEDRAAANKKMEEAGFSTATNNLAQAETQLKANKAQVQQLQDQLNRINEDLAVAKNRYSSAKAKLDESKSQYDEAVEFHQENKIEKRLEGMHAQQQIVGDLDLKVQDLDAQKAAVT